MKISLVILATLIQSYSFALWPDLSIPTKKDALVTKTVTTINKLKRDSIKFLNWNIYKGKKTNWARDFESLAQRYDIITLQEIITTPAVEDSLERLDDFQRVYAYSFKYNKDQSYTGLATLSKINAIESRYRASTDLEPITNTPKVSLYTKYEIENSKEKLLVANIHSINFVSTQAFKNQLEQVYEELEKHKGPIILVGDFNTWSSRRLISLYLMAKELNLAPVIFKPDTRKKIMGLALDHIFTRGLSLEQARSMDEIKSSDHVAMEIEFSLID
jgi:endonuclease/exonuclease/phosphatase (EEP) superfamily protein YafD